MKRVMLLAFLALALPMAVSATTTQIRYNTGTPATNATGTFSAGFPMDFTATVSCPSCTVVPGTVGGLVTMTFMTTNLDCPSVFCSFTNGDVKVSRGTSTLFTSGVSGAGATVLQTGSNFILTGATLIAPSSDHFFTGGSLSMSLLYSSVTTGVATGGNGAIIVSRVVPEPGTLGLLGTGVLALVGMMRRKLKLGT